MNTIPINGSKVEEDAEELRRQTTLDAMRSANQKVQQATAFRGVADYQFRDEDTQEKFGLRRTMTVQRFTAAFDPEFPELDEDQILPW